MNTQDCDVVMESKEMTLEDAIQACEYHMKNAQEPDWEGVYGWLKEYQRIKRMWGE